MGVCIVVCGMHRAGTSLVSRLLYEAGVYMGPSSITKPDPANTEGEFENPQFVGLNNILLKEAGGSWNKPLMVQSHGDGRAKLLIEQYGHLPVWGWKDNRTAFTFRAYEPFLNNVLFVVCRRQKESVIKSLHRTHSRQFPEENRNDEYFSWLYDRYYEAIREVSTGYSTLTVKYEDLIYNNSFNPELRHF